MEITTTPSCKVGWEGQVLRYVVTATDATEIVAVEDASEDMRVRVVETRSTAGGVEADLEVEVLNSTPY